MMLWEEEVWERVFPYRSQDSTAAAPWLKCLVTLQSPNWCLLYTHLCPRQHRDQRKDMMSVSVNLNFYLQLVKISRGHPLWDKPKQQQQSPQGHLWRLMFSGSRGGKGSLTWLAAPGFSLSQTPGKCVDILHCESPQFSFHQCQLWFEL